MKKVFVCSPLRGDIEGNIINDGTVVEVIYVNDASLPHQYRWKILRTRWDKTESVHKFGRRYGNAQRTALAVWRSITNPILMTDFKILILKCQFVLLSFSCILFHFSTINFNSV